MKRYINSNDFGGKMILTIVIVGIGIPALVYAVSRGLEALGIRWPVLQSLFWGALAVGLTLSVGFIGLLVIEQIQDHLLYKRYLKTRGKRVRRDNNGSECPFCGCRNIREFEAFCPVCGQKLS
jgi:hypothetical protein